MHLQLCLAVWLAVTLGHASMLASVPGLVGCDTCHATMPSPSAVPSTGVLASSASCGLPPGKCTYADVRASRCCSPERRQPVDASPAIGDQTDVTATGRQGCPLCAESRGLALEWSLAAPPAGTCKGAVVRSEVLPSPSSAHRDDPSIDQRARQREGCVESGQLCLCG